MPKFTFIAEHDSGQIVTYECEHDFLDNILEDFHLFIRGVGFYPQGERLEFVSDEDYYDKPEWQTEEWNTPQELQDDIGRSDHFYDTQRNR